MNNTWEDNVVMFAFIECIVFGFLAVFYNVLFFLLVIMGIIILGLMGIKFQEDELNEGREKEND